MYAASPVTPRSRLGGTRTVKPRPCKSDVTAFQLAPSAQAPWTRTIVGSVIVSPLAEAPAARCGTGAGRSRPVQPTAPGRWSAVQKRLVLVPEEVHDVTSQKPSWSEGSTVW